MTPTRRAVLGVFLITFLSYAFFWQARDWNSASRLMLTYALGDRGTVSINGLDQQTGDKAFYRGLYYSDKLPGFSCLGLTPYLVATRIFHLPPHPINQPGFAYWPADYWVTLATSGLASALTCALLVWLSLQLGCGHRSAILVGLAYGLATPAYAYATLAYGHQASAFALLASFALLWRRSGRSLAGQKSLTLPSPGGRGEGYRSPLPPGEGARKAGEGPRLWTRTSMLLAGAFAAYASVLELQVGPVSAILGLWCVAQAITKQRSWNDVAFFALGASGPTLFLALYNIRAFGSPFEMGYFHHATARFAEVHSKDNPLGLNLPNIAIVGELLWGQKRGLLIFAPIVALTPFGVVGLFKRGETSLAIVISLIMLSIFCVNLSYPEWTGGWSTGPRLLVPLLPFALLAVAGLLAQSAAWMLALAIVMTTLGWLEMTFFLAVGGRIPDPIAQPLLDGVWPLWAGEPVPGWATNGRFARTMFDLIAARKPPQSGPIAFVALAFAQVIVSATLLVALRSKDGRAETGAPLLPSRPRSA